MSGTGAIAVLRQASLLIGDPSFMGSTAEAIRLASLHLDEAPRDAAFLMEQIRSPEDMMKRIGDLPPIQRAFSRKRKCADCDAAIAKLMDVVQSMRKRRGIYAARLARNWANAQRGEKARDAEVARTFAMAHEDAKSEFPDPGPIFVKAPRPETPRIITTGSGSRRSAE